MSDQSLVPDSLEKFLLSDIASGSAHLIRVRWLVGAVVLLATFFCAHVLDLSLPEGALYGTGLVILLFSGVLFWTTRQARAPGAVLYHVHTRQIVIAQLVFDWLSIAVLLHLTGGIASPLLPFLLFHMLLVAVYLRGRLLYLEGVSAVGALIAIALLERAGVLPHHNIIPDFPPDLHKNTAFVTGQLSFVALTAIAIPYLTAVIKARLSAAECKILVLEQTSHAISSMLSQPEFLNHLAHSAAEALSVPYASIRLLDETGEHLALAATYGLSQAYLAKGPVTLSRSEIDREALAGRPVIVHDVSSDPRVQYPTQMTREGIRSLLDVPIIGRGKPLGVLRVYSNRPHRFTPLDVDYVTAIARQSATALEYAVTCQGLQNSEETRAHFVRMVTHELRSPVSGAQSLVRTLLHSRGAELNPQQRDIVTRIEARLDLLMALIDDLLALAASKTVGQEEQLEGILLQPVLEQVIGRLTPEAEAKQIRLNLDAPVRVLAVHATEEGLARVFINLIGNAIKYTPAGGRVDVTVVERLGTAGVSVADTGIGIPRADLPHLWEEFFRAGNAKRSGIKGTGLGLSIVKQLVDHFGGLIEVHSVEGEGTTFNVTLPLDRLPLVNPADGHSAQIA